MITQKRNRTPFWYSLYQGITEVVDSNGLYTGEQQVTYADPVQVTDANISASNGTDQAEMFGVLTDYDRVIITHDMSCPITENSVLFVDKLPEMSDGVPKYDYIVKKVAKSKNVIAIAIRKVDVDTPTEEENLYPKNYRVPQTTLLPF